MGYTVCPMHEATHVVFSELDLELAEDGKNFTMNHVYPIWEVGETGVYFIFDDRGKAIIGFDLFIPCESLKRVEEKEHIHTIDAALSINVVSLSDYRNSKK